MVVKLDFPINSHQWVVTGKKLIIDFLFWQRSSIRLVRGQVVDGTQYTGLLALSNILTPHTKCEIGSTRLRRQWQWGTAGFGQSKQSHAATAHYNIFHGCHNGG